MRSLRQLILVLLTSAFLIKPGIAAGQSSDVAAFWEMDIPPESGWHVGDPIPLRLRVMTPLDVVATLPDLPGEWGTFEIREQSITKQEMKGERKYFLLEVTVQLWTVGAHETPPTLILLQREGDDSYKIEARPLIVEIVSVLSADSGDGELDKRDLKPQADLPEPPLWPWLLAALVAAPLLYLGGRWLWRKIPRRQRTIQAEMVLELEDTRLPEDIAYACLDRIASMDLPGIGAIKQHYSMVTDCIRNYLRGIYGIQAMDMTTTELRCALRHQRIETETLFLLWDLFEQADKVKFAKLLPEVAQARDIVRWGRNFVDCTKPQCQDSPVAVLQAGE